MAAISQDQHPDTLSPDELASASREERLHAYSEDWISAPRVNDSGAALGAETHRQVLDLFQQGHTEASIQAAAMQELADEETRITQRHRRNSFLVFGLCMGIAFLSAMLWSGRGDGHHLMNMLLLGAVGLMLAHGILSAGQRKRSRLMRSDDARKHIWRRAIRELSARNT